MILLRTYQSEMSFYALSHPIHDASLLFFVIYIWYVLNGFILASSITKNVSQTK